MLAILGIGFLVGLVWLSLLRWRFRRNGKVRRVRPARHGVLLLNPSSGGGKVDRFELAQEARKRGVEPVFLADGEDLREAAKRAVVRGADVLGVAGGDGSQATVADVARRHDVPFVCVPAGVHNHFALDLGLDRQNVSAALDGFGDAVERRVDLAEVGDRVFVNNASVGLHTVHSDHYRETKTADRDPADSSTRPEVPEFGFRFNGPDGATRGSADLVLVSNNLYVTRTAKEAGTRPHLDHAELGVLVVRAGRREADQAQALPDVEHWETAEFRMDCAVAVPVALDGETLQLEPPLEFRSLPGALRVRLPRSVPGAARASGYGLRGTLATMFQAATDGAWHR